MKGRIFKNKAAVVLAAMSAAVVGPTFADAGSIDTTQALAYVAGGVVAAGAITAAMLGLVALIGAGKKAMRAGT